MQRTAGVRDGDHVLDQIPARMLTQRVDGPAARIVVLALRLVTGMFLIGVGIGKFADHASELADFRHYGVPLADLAVTIAGVVEVAGGVCVVLGLLIRPAAAMVAVNLLVALLTAGLTDGGTFHLVIGPAVMGAMVLLVVTGAPAPSADQAILSRRSPRRIPR